MHADRKTGNGTDKDFLLEYGNFKDTVGHYHRLVHVCMCGPGMQTYATNSGTAEYGKGA